MFDTFLRTMLTLLVLFAAAAGLAYVTMGGGEFAITVVTAALFAGGVCGRGTKYHTLANVLLLEVMPYFGVSMLMRGDATGNYAASSAGALLLLLGFCVSLWCCAAYFWPKEPLAGGIVRD